MTPLGRAGELGEAAPVPLTSDAGDRYGRHPARVLLLSSLGIFVIFIDTTIVNVGFVTISRSFNATNGHLSWILNAYSLALAAALVPAGRMADRYGRKRTFLLGLGGFGAMSALCGFAPDVGVLIAGRACQGLFAALIVPATLALILPEFTGGKRHAAVGIWGAMAAAAAAVGPVLGALLVKYASWHWIFLANIPVCALLIGSGALVLRESRDLEASGIPDLTGVVLVAAVPGLLSFAVIEGPGWGWSDPWIIAAFALGTALIPVFAWRNRVARRPAMDVSLFRVRQFLLVNVGALLYGVPFYGTLLASVTFLQTAWHYSVLVAALGTTPGPLAVVLVAPVGGRLAAAIGPRLVLVVGAVLSAGGLVTYTLLVTAAPDWPAHWLPAAMINAVGIGLTIPVQSSAAVAPLPSALFAVGSSVNASFRQLGSVLGISLFVVVLGAPNAATIVSSYDHVWLMFAAFAVISAAPLFLPSRAALPRHV